MKTSSYIFLIIAVATTLFWTFSTPVFEFPDEQAHFESVEFLAKEGRMPAGEEWDMTKEMGETQQLLGVYRDRFGNNKLTYHPEYRLEYTDSTIGKYENDILALNNGENRNIYVAKEAARYPRLYYDYLSFGDGLVRGSDIITRVFVLRIANIVLALITALFVYLTGVEIFHKAAYARTLVLLVMLQPMYSFLSAGINSDNLHNLLFAGVIYAGMILLNHKLNIKIMIFSCLVIALDIYTKPQGFVSIPIILSAIMLRSIASHNWKLLLGFTGIGIISAFAILNPLNPYAPWFNPANITGASLIEFIRFSLNKLVTQNIVWYWGVFKWLGVVLPPIYWQVANRLVILAAIGIIVYFVKASFKKKLVTAQLSVIYLIATVAIYSLSIYWFDWQYTKTVGYSIGVQARYLFPTIAAQMALLIIGITSLAPNVFIRKWLRRALVLLFVWLQVGGLWRMLSSYYDTSSVSIFIAQASQYKPWFAKGDWWYLWGGLYIVSVLYLTYIAIFPASRTRLQKPKTKA